MHYAVKRAYAPLAVQAIKDESQVQLFVVSDLLDTSKTTITLRLVSLSDGPSSCGSKRGSSARKQDDAGSTSDSSTQAGIVGSFDYDVPGLFATRVLKMEAAELLKRRAGCTPTTCYLSVTAQAPGVDPSESQLWFTPFKNLALPDPRIVIDDVKQLSPVEVSLTVRSLRPAPLVMLSSGPERVGHFTDNGFNLDPCEPRTVTFISHDSVFEERDMRDPKLFTAESLFDHSSWSGVDSRAGKAALPAGAADAAAKSSKNERPQ